MILLLVTGLVAGFIDAIAGGGGLLTLPVLTLVLGPGPHAIGTNKIVGTVGACVALLMYARRTSVPWKRSIQFSSWILLGSFAGSFASPFLPREAFRWLLIGICPVILILLWRKEVWIERGTASSPLTQHAAVRVAASGFLCGFYDGAFGPGGGTFMFLALLFVAKFPLFAALAASKLANTVSAGTALVGYSVQGYVHPREGITTAIGMGTGALLGAGVALRGAERVVRPFLALICLLLLVKIARDAGMFYFLN